ncbi:Vps54-domain-containing protein [Cryphonectria parasitica EP155]|uniref:Vps54-domain-containing protein n=1 Tax=Cryphonectria parasitica (strain ATCC 38755 / EP155) TaxID=660469 RepID=A0A9P4YD49_CRYP1|nr:Vps54-domain-containing protein [Cryphonectria parasitica EP155]KAF3770682.1 Vps54-domain-containing protein [Cryphonectria parasitica EP155]
MYSNPAARKSIDSLASPTSPQSHRADFPFHSESVLEIGQNAISTLLQPPIVRTGLLPHTTAPASSAHKPPTARDIPPVTLTNIQKINPSEFEPYLKQVGALYRQLQQVKESEEEDVLNRTRGGKGDEVGDSFSEDTHNRLRPGRRPPNSRKASVSSISSFTGLDAPPIARRSSSSYSRKSAQGPPPLSTIPVVYFDEDFHLENPRTFDVVSERSEVVRQEEKASSNGNATAPRKALATNAILQEKLSWYMDTVEMHLISAISTASTTFFSALGSLKELHTETAESVQKIKTLREELEAVDEEIVLSGLHTVQIRRRRENVQQLHDAVLQLKEVVNQLANCESMVDSGDVDAALDGIDALEGLIAGEEDESIPPPSALRTVQLRDLRGAIALQGVNEDMNVLRSRIGKAYETKFVASLIADLRRHVENVSTREVLVRWNSASIRARGGRTPREPTAFPSYLESTDDLRAKLIESLGGLYRAKQITNAVTAYRDSVIKEVRSLVKQGLPSSNDDDNMSVMSASTATGGGRKLSQREKSSILARNLRALEPADAEELLVKVYVSVTETLRRTSTQVKLMLDVAASIEDGSIPSGMKSPPLKSPPLSPPTRRTSVAGIEAQEEIHKVLDLSAVLGNGVDIAHDKIVRILRVRSEQSTHLELVWFLRYFTLNLHFANECESMSGRSGTLLKDEVNNQIKDFVRNHGDAEQQKLATGMELDQWGAVDFTEAHKEQLQRILDSSTSDPGAWALGTQVWIPYPEEDENEENGVVEKSSQSNGSGKAKAIIDSETFVLPNSAVYCMDGMSNFLHLIVGIPSITSDVAKSLIKYLQFFDSRCKQLILGAGATRTAGLRNITTRHLASSSQALSFVAALIPYVREFARRHAGSGSASSALMGEFDKVKRDYQEHTQTIFDKLVEIMSGRATAHAKTAKATDWEKETKGAHAYMETLVKETSLLYKNLCKHLSDDAVRMIMVPVFTSIKEQFGADFRVADPKTAAGRDSMLRDFEFFKSKLQHIDGFGNTGDYLIDIVKSKQVKPASQPPPPPPSETKTEEKQDTGAIQKENGNESSIDQTEDKKKDSTGVETKS